MVLRHRGVPSLTCIVGSDSADEARQEMEVMDVILLERSMMGAGCVGAKKYCIGVRVDVGVGVSLSVNASVGAGRVIQTLLAAMGASRKVSQAGTATENDARRRVAQREMTAGL